MSTTTITPYEAEQVREIALWKSERPSYIEALTDGLVGPISRLVARVIPRQDVEQTVQKAAEASGREDLMAEIARRARVADITVLKTRPLEECDRLAEAIDARYERSAIAEAATISASMTTVDHVVPGRLGAELENRIEGRNAPALLLAAIRSITLIGHCYGYPLDRLVDHATVMALLEISTVDNPTERQNLLDQLHTTLDEAPAELPRITFTHLQEREAEDEILESVPWLGALMYFVLDFDFIYEVDVTARRVFQERWLRDNNKVASIRPAPALHRRSSLREFAGAMTTSVYMGGAAASFVATFPFFLASALTARAENPLVDGLHDGGADALRDARRLKLGVKASASPTAGEAVAPSAQPAIG